LVYGYQEFIEYDKIIGVFYTKEGAALPTKCGKVHYNIKNEYHVVPCHPDIFKFKRSNG